MQRRVVVAAFVFGVVGAAVVAVAQPPATPPAAPPVGLPPIPASEPVPPAPPRTAPVTIPPASAAETPLAKFEPLAAFPQQTQNAVRGVILGANWMTRMSQPQGRFLFGYNPALRQSLAGDHDLKQARGALALAMAAKFTGDEKHATIASQAILAMLASTRLDPTDPNCRVPVHSPMVCNRVGFAATVALAIYELPGADPRLVAEAERLCGYLRKQCRPNGSVDCSDGTGEEVKKSDPEGVQEYPGVALHAIVASNRVSPAAWKTDAAKLGVDFYRTAFRTNPQPLMAAALTPAAAELYLQTKSAEAAAAVFEMNDWLCSLQIPGTDPRTPQWAGGFRAVVDGKQAAVPPGPETGGYVQSLAYACRITRLTPDLDRYARYKAAVTDAVHFLTGTQYLDMNTNHFDLTFRAQMLIGGFYLSPADGNLRIDATGNAVVGLVRFLGCGAER